MEKLHTVFFLMFPSTKTNEKKRRFFIQTKNTIIKNKITQRIFFFTRSLLPKHIRTNSVHRCTQQHTKIRAGNPLFFFLTHNTHCQLVFFFFFFFETLQFCYRKWNFGVTTCAVHNIIIGVNNPLPPPFLSCSALLSNFYIFFLLCWLGFRTEHTHTCTRLQKKKIYILSHTKAKSMRERECVCAQGV